MRIGNLLFYDNVFLDLKLMFLRVINREGRDQWCCILVFKATTWNQLITRNDTKYSKTRVIESFYVEVFMWKIHGTDCDK